MALLQSDKVRYYHPLNDSVESTKSLTWSVGFGTLTGFLGGQVGNAMRTSAAAAQARLVSPASVYTDLAGSTHFAAAFWSLNLFGTALIDRSVDIGFGTLDIANGLRNGFKLRKQGGTVIFSGTWTGLSSNKSVTSPPVDGGWHFTVLDLFLEANWRLRVSFDGLPFTDEGLFTSGIVPDTDIRGFVQAISQADTRLDEVALWSGHDLFTTQELANLYDLGNTFGEGLNQYSQNFTAPLCWQATATMPGGKIWRDSGSGNCPPAIRVPRGSHDIVVTDAGVLSKPRIIEG